jgi:hypothetical protein
MGPGNYANLMLGKWKPGNNGFDVELSFNAQDGKNAKDKLQVQVANEQRATLTTVYFTEKNLTYAITECMGMMCNPNSMAWLTTFNGNKKIKHESCDEDSVTSFSFNNDRDKSGKFKPDKEDKNGNLVFTSKSPFILKKSSLDFSRD